MHCEEPLGRTDIRGADLGPPTIALVPRPAAASLEALCEELAPDEKQVRRLQRQKERQRRAANPDNYDEKGRIRSSGGKKKLHWKSSKSYEKTRRRKASKERKLAAYRKSLHGQKVHQIVAMGNTIIIEKLSYKAWQKQYGRSVGTFLMEVSRLDGAPSGKAGSLCKRCVRALILLFTSVCKMWVRIRALARGALRTIGIRSS